MKENNLKNNFVRNVGMCKWYSEKKEWYEKVCNSKIINNNCVEIWKKEKN